MALSSQAPVPGKVKPVPPPKPLTPHQQSPSKPSLVDGQKGECHLDARGAKQLLLPKPIAGGLRGRPSKESEGNIGDIKNPLKTPLSKNCAFLISKSLLPEGNAITHKKLISSNESNSKSCLPISQEPVQHTVERKKPPLLPKPQSGCIANRIAPKPPIPKRPDIDSSVRRSIQDSGTQTPPLGKSVRCKAATLEKFEVSKSATSSLQHFDSVVGKGCDNPVRPPRSPKNKPFTGMPFDFLCGKQNLSAKQKNLSLPQGARQSPSIWTFWNSDSIGLNNKEEIISQREVQGKACSLERNVTLVSCENLSSRPGIGFKFPIPPPRRGKKKSPSDPGTHLFPFLNHPGNSNAPVYAVVNYELKKNRRSQGMTDIVDIKNSIVIHDDLPPNVTSSPAVEGSTPVESLVTNETDIGCDFQTRSFDTVIDEVEKKSGCEISREIDDKSTCESLKEYCNSCGKCVMDSMKECKAVSVVLKHSTLTQSVKKETDDCDTIETSISVTPHTAAEHSDPIMQEECILPIPIKNESALTNSTICVVCNDCSNGKYEKESSVHKYPLEEESELNGEVLKEIGPCAEFLEKQSNPSSIVDFQSTGPCFHSTGCRLTHEKQSLLTEIIKEPSIVDVDKGYNSIAMQGNDNIDGLTKLEIPASTTDSENKKTLTVLELSQCTCKMSQVPLESKKQFGDFLSKTSSESDCSPWADALENKRSGDGDDLEFKLKQTLSLPMRSKLNVVHGRSNEPSRRQSWSDGQKKENSGSSMTASGKQRRKRRGHSLWCDEGDLSSGTLGDQSSFEDVPVEETGEATPVRRRLSALFSSFGKSSRKPYGIAHKQKEKKAGRIVSKFYCNSQDEDKHVKQEDCAVQDPCLNSETKDISSSSRVDKKSIEERDARQIKSEMDNGVSELCVKVDSLDMKRKSGEFGSGSHLSEESFDNAPSESENEEMAHTEEKLDTSLSEFQRREKKAFYIAQELMTSENVFVDALRLLSIDFRNAVLTAGTEQKNEIIPEADLCKILNNLPQLLRFNEDLLHDLENRIHNWNSSQKISDIIVRKGPFLKLYISYFQNFETQCQYLEEYCESNPRFARVVRDFEASPRCQKLAIKHYMLKPIQRVPQYRLLLEDYLAHLEPGSADFEDTQVALSIVCDVADHANRSMKQGDALSKLLQLQSILKNYVIIKPGRAFLKEGELQKLCRKGMQNRYFILLNDCLLYAAYDRSVQAPGSLKVNYELPLNGMKVEIPVAEDYTNEFSVISTARSFTLSASSAQERIEWVNALLRAIQDNTTRQLTFLQMKLAQDSSKQKGSESFQLGMAAPVWIQDCRVTMCQQCTSEFTVTFRRHHCRACGKVVCGSCSANKAPLQYMKFQAARVCDECYESLLKEFDDNQRSMQEAIQHEICSADFADTAQALESIRASFKKLGPTTGRKIKKFIPQRLKEVCANDTGSQMSGWLNWRCRRSWKKMWFVLKEQVLYVYKASEDVVALESIPILGYQVLIPSELENMKHDGVEAGIAFSLTHKGKQYLEFQADNIHSSKRWINAMQEATVLK